MIEAVDYLERAGGWLHEEAITSMLGSKRARDVRRRYLELLEARGVVESSGKEWRLTKDWRCALEKVFAEERDLERALYSGRTADECQKDRNQRDRERYRNRHEVVPDRAPTQSEMKEHRDTFLVRRRKALEGALVRLFADKSEYRSRRVGQITCALVSCGYLPDTFPRGSYGLPKDAEVEAVLDGVRVA